MDGREGGGRLATNLGTVIDLKRIEKEGKGVICVLVEGLSCVCVCLF